MQCSKCGAFNDNDKVYCSECGNSLTRDPEQLFETIENSQKYGMRDSHIYAVLGLCGICALAPFIPLCRMILPNNLANARNFNIFGIPKVVYGFGESMKTLFSSPNKPYEIYLIYALAVIYILMYIPSVISIIKALGIMRNPNRKTMADCYKMAKRAAIFSLVSLLVYFFGFLGINELVKMHISKMNLTAATGAIFTPGAFLIALICISVICIVIANIKLKKLR